MKMNERIVQLLSNAQMNQKELAEKSGVTESAISHYIKGDRVPRGVNLKKIAVALNTTVDDILGSCGAEDKDVDISQAEVGDVLMFKGTKWEAESLDGGTFN